MDALGVSLFVRYPGNVWRGQIGLDLGEEGGGRICGN